MNNDTSMKNVWQPQHHCIVTTVPIKHIVDMWKDGRQTSDLNQSRPPTKEKAGQIPKTLQQAKYPPEKRRKNYSRRGQRIPATATAEEQQPDNGND